MKYYFLFLAICVITCGVVAVIRPELMKSSEDKPKIDLPEEYKEITRDTPIEGHFEGDVLVIEFKH